MKKFIFALSGLLPCLAIADNPTKDAMFELHKEYNAKIGVYSINDTNKKTFAYNQDYKFPICSVFKFLLAGAVLHKDMQESGFLNKKILITEDDVKNLGYAPVTGNNVGKYMTISELTYAAILSDNPAANILIFNIGGLEVLNNFIKSLGDSQTVISDYEPYMNYTTREGTLNKTTPKSIANDMHTLAFGNVLDEKHKKIFINWLQKNTTGKNRIAYSVPRDWTVGDKTGTCDYGSTNDVAILWPDDKDSKPITLAVLYTDPMHRKAPANEEAIQKATKIALQNIQK